MVKFALIFFFLIELLWAETSPNSFRRRIERIKEDKSALSTYSDMTHDYLSRHLLAFSNSVDRFFSNERADDYINTTQVRLNYLVIFPDKPQYVTEFDFRLNFVLPRTQKKLQLFAENIRGSQNQDDGRGDVVTGVTDPQSRRASQGAVGVRSQQDVQNFRLTNDAGVRTNFPNPQLFYRFRVNGEFPQGKSWMFRPRFTANWLSLEGISHNGNLDFDRPFRYDLNLRLINFIGWEQETHIINTNHGLVLFQRIDDTKGFSYSAIGSFSDTPLWQIESYIYRIGYRQLLYKDWFFGEFAPEVVYARLNDFKAAPALNFRFEIVIGFI
jgi:hypothetical protein